MAHTIKDVDGLKVYVVSDMNRRYDEDGNLVSQKDMGGLEIVHARDIATYYNIPLHTIGKGANAVPGIWSMVHDNEIGQRVPYNTEETKSGDRHIRTWKILKDANGEPRDTKEMVIKTTRHWDAGKSGAGLLTDKPLLDEIDDGMYVKLSDLRDYASVMGWEKGKGRPGQAAKIAATNDEKLDKMAEAITALTKLVASLAVKK